MGRATRSGVRTTATTRDAPIGDRNASARRAQIECVRVMCGPAPSRQSPTAVDGGASADNDKQIRASRRGARTVIGVAIDASARWRDPARSRATRRDETEGEGETLDAMEWNVNADVKWTEQKREGRKPKTENRKPKTKNQKTNGRWGWRFAADEAGRAAAGAAARRRAVCSGAWEHGSGWLDSCVSYTDACERGVEDGLGTETIIAVAAVAFVARIAGVDERRQKDGNRSGEELPRGSQVVLQLLSPPLCDSKRRTDGYG